jgi:hypothetical protein
MRKGLLFAAVLATSMMAGTAAMAAEPSPADLAQARDLSVQAQQMFEQGKFDESEKHWIAAEKLYPAAPTLTLGLARTQAKLGKLVLAQENYKKIIRENENNPNLSPAFKDAVESAKSEVGPVSARIANVVIKVEGPASPTVTIDGQPVAASTLGLKRPVDPGSHTIKAEAPGYSPVTQSFQVAEAGVADATIKMEKGPDGLPPGHDSKVDVGPGKSSNKTMAFVAFGVGGAGLIFGAVTGILAIGKHGDLEDQCQGGKCPATLQDDVDSYKTMGLLSTIGFIVGGVGVAAGTVLLLTAPKEGSSSAPPAAFKTVKKTDSARLTWTPFVGAGGGGIRGTF